MGESWASVVSFVHGFLLGLCNLKRCHFGKFVSRQAHDCRSLNRESATKQAGTISSQRHSPPFPDTVDTICFKKSKSKPFLSYSSLLRLSVGNRKKTNFSWEERGEVSRWCCFNNLVADSVNTSNMRIHIIKYFFNIIIIIQNSFLSRVQTELT